MADEPHLETTLTPLGGSKPGEFVSAGGEAVPLDPPAEPGELGRFGPYRIVRVLGEGGMGIVFHALDTQLGRPVAIKMLKPTLSRQPKFRERFLREARVAVAASLQKGEHGVTVHAVSEAYGLPHIVMELLEGESLDDRLRRERSLTPDEVIRIGRAVAEGLAAAHAAGVLHRDIKPSNIWLEAPSGRVKILDYGLGRELRGDGALTTTGSLLGTPAFMAPEQARGEAMDERSDLFSLGAMLYLLGTGKLPFPGDSPMAILTALATETPPPPHEVNAALPPGLSHLILRLLAKDPVLRPTAAKEVASALQALYLAPDSTPTALLTPPPPHTLPAPPRTRKRKRVLVRLLLMAVVTVTVLPLGCCAAVILVPAIQRVMNVRRSIADLNRTQPSTALPVPRKPMDLDALSRSIAGKAPLAQINAVETELAVRNGTAISLEGADDDGKQVTRLHLILSPNSKFDISPLRALPGLKVLHLDAVVHGGRGGPSVTIINLAELSKLPLQELRCTFVKFEDLTPLKEMPLTAVRLVHGTVHSLEPLRGKKLKSLDVSNNAIQDFLPLEKMPLERLNISANPVTDLTPLKGMPLVELNCTGTQVKTLEPLEGNPTLTTLYFEPLDEKNKAIVRRLPVLKTLNGGPIP